MLLSLSPWIWVPMLAVMSIAMVGGTRLLLLRAGILDVPNARSNHTHPVARGGGVAVMTLLLAAGYVAGLPLDILLLSAVLTVLCFVDDVRGLSAKLKLVVQLLMVFAAWRALPLPDVSRLVAHFGLPVSSEVNGVSMASGYVIFFGLLFIPMWVWWMNATNFMDGIDGISGVQTVTLALGILMLAPYLPNLPVSVPLTAGALLAIFIGFLVWNWHPAKIFMGDSGSVPLGFVTGFLLWKLAANGAIIAGLLLVAYSVLEATGTLLLRAWRREKLLQAHSAHAYQRAVRRGMRHDQVVLRLAVLNLLLLLLAYLSLHGGIISWMCLIVGYGAAAWFMLRLGGGWKALRQNPQAMHDTLDQHPKGERHVAI